MARPNTCSRRPRGVALALALALAGLLTFAVVGTAESLADLAAAVHLGA
jgi:Tfp pilus assembly protein PilX